MRILILILLFPFFGSAQVLTETKIAGYNALVWTPAKAITRDGTIFIHGLGEGGTDISMLYRNGPFQFIKNGTLKPDQYFFAFQGPKGTWINSQMVTKVMDSIMRRWPVDTFNLTGLSMGAAAIFNVMEDSKHRDRIRNIVAFSMNRVGTGLVWSQDKYSKVNFWGISGNTDSRTAVLRSFTGGLISKGYKAKYFEFIGGHCCWSTYYNPTWKTNGVGVYDWLSQGSKPVLPPVVKPPVTPPVAPTLEMGGELDIIVTPVTIGLNARVTAKAPTYLWEVVSFTGPAPTIENPTMLNTQATGLGLGSYTFRLTVTDQGLKTSGTLTYNIK